MAVVTVQRAVAQVSDHPYATIVKEDWRNYPGKAALQGQFGVEGRLHECTAPDGLGGTKCDPHLPVEQFWDLVTDPLFGKVIRYNGGPELNTKTRGMPGRTALHGVRLRGQYTHVWVRQFVRFSSNYTTTSVTGGQGGPSYKVMFLRYHDSGARHEWTIDGPRGVYHRGGNPGLTRIEQGILPWNNVQVMNRQYRVEGWPFPDVYPMIKVPGPAPSAPPRAPFGNGDGEWYEVVLHHKTVAERGEFTMYWRRYTYHGSVSPGPWKIDAKYLIVQAGQTFRGVSIYTMGVNRNRQYDEEMFVYWGPFEIVDGSKYPNPWGLPGQ
jgi:hypothetical protein